LLVVERLHLLWDRLHSAQVGIDRREVFAREPGERGPRHERVVLGALERERLGRWLFVELESHDERLLGPAADAGGRVWGDVRRPDVRARRRGQGERVVAGELSVLDDLVVLINR